MVVVWFWNECCLIVYGVLYGDCMVCVVCALTSSACVCVLYGGCMVCVCFCCMGVVCLCMTFLQGCCVFVCMVCVWTLSAGFCLVCV